MDKTKLAGLFGVAALGLAACTQAAPTSTPTPTPTATESTAPTPSGSSATTKAESSSPTAPVPGRNIDYSEYVNNKAAYADSTVVLSFSASWCPTCQELNRNLANDGVPAGLTVVKVDFDSSQDLKQKYGVVQQHTLVQINNNGNEVKKWTSSLTGEQIKQQVA